MKSNMEGRMDWKDGEEGGMCSLQVDAPQVSG